MSYRERSFPHREPSTPALGICMNATDVALRTEHWGLINAYTTESSGFRMSSLLVTRDRQTSATEAVAQRQHG
jgi:hypothetical protein